MQKTLLLFFMLCAYPGFPQGDSDDPGNIKYTKYQRNAAGFWSVTDTDEPRKIAWLVIFLGDSPNTMMVKWPTGLGCQDEPAEIKKDTITVVGHLIAVIQIQGPKTATVSLAGGQVLFHMKKTNEGTDLICE